MIAACPKCSARYRVDPEKLGTEGARLRCAKCDAVFRVKAPQDAPAAVPAPIAQPPAAGPGVAQSAAAQPVAGAAAPAVEAPVTGPVDSARAVLIADPDVENGKATAAALASWGLQPLLVHDGVEAILAIQRNLPTAIVIDAALPKMFGFQVCEVVKRNESLRHIKVVLIGAIHQQDRYRRDPTDLYGADVYLEQPDLPDGLRPLLREEGLPCSDGEEPVSSEAGVVPTAMDLALDSPNGPESMPEPEPTPISEAPSAAPEPDPVASTAPPEVEDPEITAERERAERLARIAVSEMLLYQPEKFDAAIRDQNLEEVLDLEIQEARALIRQRISEEVRSEKDFILEELERVAEERSGQA
jgi:predicted Zn finger-like uncharacterized protein